MTRERLEGILNLYLASSPSRQAAAISEVRNAYDNDAIRSYRAFAPHRSEEMALLGAAWDRTTFCVHESELKAI